MYGISQHVLSGKEIMQTPQKISAIILIMGAVQSIFLSLLLIGGKRRHYTPNWKLSGVFAALAIGYIAMSGRLLSHEEPFVSIFNILMPAMIASVPLMYLYIKSITYVSIRELKRNFFHFIPLCALILYPLIFKAPTLGLAGNIQAPNVDHQYYVRVVWAVYALFYFHAVRKLSLLHACYTVTLQYDSTVLSSELLDHINKHIWIRRLLAVSCAYWLFNIILLAFPRSPLFAIVSAFAIYIPSFMILNNPLICIDKDQMMFVIESKHKE